MNLGLISGIQVCFNVHAQFRLQCGLNHYGLLNKLRMHDAKYRVLGWSVLVKYRVLGYDFLVKYRILQKLFVYLPKNSGND